MAFGVSEPTPYGDPTAILTGTWNPEQMAEATVRVVKDDLTRKDCCHEVEIRLRTTIDTAARSITGYEVYCSVLAGNPYAHIASWGGPNGVWVNMEQHAPAIALKDGDVLRATITGTYRVVITMYVNGVNVLQVEDTGGYTFSDGKKYGPWPTGAPGIGLFDNRDTNWGDFGVSRFAAADF
jgi:hypothetical protein